MNDLRGLPQAFHIAFLMFRLLPQNRTCVTESAAKAFLLLLYLFYNLISIGPVQDFVVLASFSSSIWLRLSLSGWKTFLWPSLLRFCLSWATASLYVCTLLFPGDVIHVVLRSRLPQTSPHYHAAIRVHNFETTADRTYIDRRIHLSDPLPILCTCALTFCTWNFIIFRLINELFPSCFRLPSGWSSTFRELNRAVSVRHSFLTSFYVQLHGFPIPLDVFSLPCPLRFNKACWLKASVLLTLSTIQSSLEEVSAA